MKFLCNPGWFYSSNAKCHTCFMRSYILLFFLTTSAWHHILDYYFQLLKTSSNERETWGSKLDFMLSAIGYSVGLGNVWRFPYKCYKNGGGVFLIPYIIMLVAVALPVFVLELAIGQFSSSGPISVWRISPMFKGIGWAMLVISFWTSVYYNVILAYTNFFLVSSIIAIANGELPWAHCGHSWNTENCSEFGNSSKLDNISSIRRISPSEEYWKYVVLQTTDSIDDAGGLNWWLVLSLFVAWILVFGCICKGVKSSGKVVYFTALFPYVVLVILLLRGATLEGAGKGVSYFFRPDFSKLQEASVWIESAGQILYSMGPGFGGLITMGSYNKFNNNFLRDSIIIAAIDLGTSIFAGVVIFTMIGFMATQQNVDISAVARDGPDLAFIVYPEGIAQIPGVGWAIAISIMFFLMLITLGLDSQFVMVEVISTVVVDMYPELLRKRKFIFTAVLSLVLFLIGLSNVCRGGFFVFTLFDTYAASYSLLFAVVAELVVVNIVYGQENFLGDIQMMIGYQPNVYWRLCWRYVSPLLTSVILVFGFVQYKPLSLDNYVFPVWANTVGWVMAATSVVMIPAFATKQLLYNNNFRTALTEAIEPSSDWGPLEAAHRTGRYEGGPHGSTLTLIDAYSDYDRAYACRLVKATPLPSSSATSMAFSERF